MWIIRMRKGKKKKNAWGATKFVGILYLYEWDSVYMAIQTN